MRCATDDDFGQIVALDGASFGFHYGPEETEAAELDVDPNRFLVEEDAGRIVGATADMPLAMTLPGGEAAAAGVTWVSVEATHRRRGILRALVERQLRDRAADGLAAAILTASEGAIYGRYGFGVAEIATDIVVERHRARLRRSVDDHGVRRVDTDEARELLPGLHERWRRQTPGAVNRTAERWQLELLDKPWQRDGASGLFHLVHADGYVSYRIKIDWNGGLPNHVCRLVDYAPASAEAHAALWQVLLANDLVGRIESHRMPSDDPLPLLLDNPRHVRRVGHADGLWVRPLDVAALLAARTYAFDIDTVVQVDDPLLGAGRYHLVGGPSGAQCRRTEGTADVRFDVAALGATIVGGTRVVELARVGAIAGEPQLLTRLDRALLADRAPCVGTQF